MATIAVWRRSETPVFEHARGRGETAALVAGRVIFGGYFLFSGWNHWKHRQMMSGYAGDARVLEG